MFEFGHKVRYLDKGKWRSVFMSKNTDVNTLGINKNKIDKITKTLRVKPKMLDIDTQLIVINKLQGFVASGQPNAIIYQNLLKNMPDIKIVNDAVRISDFLKSCQFSKEVVNIVQSSELSGNIDVGLESVYDYLEKQKTVSKNLQSSLKKNTILLILILLAFVFVPSSVVEMMTNMQSKLPIETNAVTDIIFWLNEYGPILLLVTSAVVLLLITNNKKIKLLISNNSNIKTIRDYTKLKETIDFLIIFKLLHKEGLDFKQSLNIIAQTQNNTTTTFIYNKIINGNNLSQAINQSDLPEDLKSTFFGFEQNTNLTLRIDILDRLINMFTRMLKTKHDALATTFDLLTTLLITSFIFLMMFGYLVPIMNSIGGAI